MNPGPFDNLPPLTKSDALRILNTPIKELALSSDYYKAVFHLAKFQCSESEEALINLVKSHSKEPEILLAKRKAIEVLGRMKSKKAIPYIGKNLQSDDPYIVENSALALQEIGCKNIKFQSIIGSLLDNPSHNHRALIQSLAKMGAITELSKIQKICCQENVSPGIKGASIAAIKILTGELHDRHILREYLDLDNQNNRQSAVQDIIDCNSYELLGDVINTPISPFFRLRAIDLIWPKIESKVLEFSILDAIDFVLLDDPRKIRLIDKQTSFDDSKTLIDELFSTDFNQCYLSLVKLINTSSHHILMSVKDNWDRFKKDYGAVYFLVILFRYLNVPLQNIKKLGMKLVKHCLDDSWPPYMKFKPQAILLSYKLDLSFFENHIITWLDEELNPNWSCRYAALLCLENLIDNNQFALNVEEILAGKNDSNQFVRLKTTNILSNLIAK